MISEIATIISIALTVPFVCYCLEIMYLWFPTFKASFKESKLSASSRLGRGIITGFTANLLDNIYWMVAWTFVLFHHPIGIVLMMAGSMVNIFFRQTGGIMSAIDHLRAARMMHKEDANTFHKLYWSAGLVVLVVLAYLKL